MAEGAGTGGELNGIGMDMALTTTLLMDVHNMLYNARTKWFDIGFVLKVDLETLRSIQGSCNEDSYCLREMLACRIQQSDHSLTLRELCKCLRNKIVGRTDVAKEIEEGTPDLAQGTDGDSAILEGESIAMEQEFNTLTTSILRSLTSRRISKKKVVASLMGIQCLKKVFDSPNQCLFRMQRTKLNNASSLEEIWIIIGEYWSFFDYYVIAHIVDSFGSREDKKCLDKYERKFNEYVKKRVFPISIGSGSRNDSARFLVKLDSTYDGCEIGRLKSFQIRLSGILNLNPEVLKLSQIRRGSIILNFQIPVFIVNLFLPLSASQKEALVDLKVVEMQCGDYSFSFRGPAPLDPTPEDLHNPLITLSDNQEVVSSLLKQLATELGPQKASSLKIPTASTTLSGASTVGTIISGVSTDSGISDSRSQAWSGSEVSVSDVSRDATSAAMAPLTSTLPTILDPTREDLPIPLFILSDNHKAANSLFQWLTIGVGPRRNSSLQVPTPGTQISDSSALSEISDPKFQSRTPGSGVSAPSNVNPPESSLKKKPDKLSFPIDSDKSMRRASISSNFTNADYSPTTTPGKPPLFGRLLSINRENIARRRYIPQMFCNGFERRFADIFLRTSGLYLVTAWLKDLANDPLIQFENISYWLRLIQQRTGCADEKRTIIVGMYNGQEKDDLEQITKYVGILNEALQESELNKQLLYQNRRRLSGATSETQHCYVFMFDVSRFVDCCYDLYERVERCMDLFAEKALYFYPETFEKVFKAFDGLNVALRELSSLTKIVASPEDLKTLCKQKPDYALATLQAYSTALIDSNSTDVLLKPHFLIDLMTQLGTSFAEDQTALYQVFELNNRRLKPLPVVSKTWPVRVIYAIASTMSDIPPISEHDKEVVIQWAERLGLMFRIDEDKRESFYYVPALASDVMGEGAKYHWDEEREKFYRSDKATVLYAFLHFPCNHQFFDQLVAVLIKEGFTKRQDLFINRGCMEAILPLCLKKDDQKILTVMTVYHPLQNVIEFRTRINTSMKVTFKDAIKDKLDTAFSSSQFAKLFSFNDSVVFHVPSTEHEEKLKQSALWKLKDLEVAQAEDKEEKDEAEKKLLKTKELTHKVMEEWAAAHPQMKEIPATMFVKWSKKMSTSDDYWSLVGAKLQLLSTDDINYYQSNPNPRGNGAEILKRWQDSDSTVAELVSALHEVKLNQLALEIEEYMLPGSDV